MRRSLAVLALALLAGSALAGCVVPQAIKNLNPFAKDALAYALQCPGAAASGWNDSREACIYRASHGPGPKEEVWAAVNPKNHENVVVAAKDLNPATSDHCTWNGIYVTKNGGKSWVDVHIGGEYASRAPGDPTYGYRCNTDPDMSFDKDGTLYYAVEMYGYNGVNQIPDPAGLGLVPGGSEFLMARSLDGGLTFPQLTVAEIGDGTLAFHDYSRMTVSPKTGTVAYATGTYNTPLFLTPPQSPASGVYITVVTSHDKGQSVDAPILLTNRSNPGFVNIGTIAAAADGTFVVSGTDVRDGTVYLWTSVDDGKSWSEPAKAFTTKQVAGQLPNTKFRAGSGLEMTFDKSALYATWSDNATGDPDVVVARSNDKGKTWGPPVRVNDDATKNAQWMANVAVTEDGLVHVLFMDRRYDPADRLIDLTYAYSKDGGKTWKNQRVTSVSFDGDLGVHQDGFPFIGDYLGLSAAGNDVWGGFPTTFTKNATIAAAHFRAP